MNSMFEDIFRLGLVPVIKIERPEQALPLGRALIAGGLPIAEVTFRTAAAAEAIRSMCRDCPELLVGAGTVINVELAKTAVEAGARFIVSPGFNPAVIDWCRDHAVPIVPGVNNPSLIEAGLEKGLSVFKFFPAEQSGGLAMLDALTAPFPQIKFMPTGGIGPANMLGYAKRSAVLAIGGSWMVKNELIGAENWEEISRLCRQAVQDLHGFSFGHMGLNAGDEKTAVELAQLFGHFGFPAEEGDISIFAGKSFEIMKGPFRGEKGHIGLRCNNIERALAHLEGLGYSPIEESIKKEGGKINTVYLNREIGGFAIHLMPASK